MMANITTPLTMLGKLRIASMSFWSALFSSAILSLLATGSLAGPLAAAQRRQCKDREGRRCPSPSPSPQKEGNAPIGSHQPQEKGAARGRPEGSGDLDWRLEDYITMTLAPTCTM